MFSSVTSIRKKCFRKVVNLTSKASEKLEKWSLKAAIFVSTFNDLRLSDFLFFPADPDLHYFRFARRRDTLNRKLDKIITKKLICLRIKCNCQLNKRKVVVDVKATVNCVNIDSKAIFIISSTKVSLNYFTRFRRNKNWTLRLQYGGKIDYLAEKQFLYYWKPF